VVVMMIDEEFGEDEIVWLEEEEGRCVCRS